MALGSIHRFNTLQAARRVLFIALSAAVVIQIATIHAHQSADAAPQPITSGFTQIATAADHSCGIRSGQAYCWGNNQNGALGIGSADTTRHDYPEAVVTTGVLSGKTVTAIGVGLNFSCVIASDNQVYCWGQNSVGELGNSSATMATAPVAVTRSGVLSGLTVNTLSVGYKNVCVIASDNNAYCWGANDYGQVGNGTTGTTQNSPVKVTNTAALNGLTITDISAGQNSSCAVASNAQVYCWGQITSATTPLQINNTAVNVNMRAVSVSGAVMCEVGVNAQSYCQGDNTYGQLGNGASGGSSATPVQVESTGVTAGQAIQFVSVGEDNTVCANSFTGRAFCWGQNGGTGQPGSGKLGQNNYTNAISAVPLAVDAFGNDTVGRIGNATAKCAVTSNGAAACFGAVGFRGDGTDGSADQMAVASYVSLAAPEVTSLSTNVIYIDGNSGTVIITGKDFDAQTTVKFGTKTMTVTAWTPTTLTVTVPTAGITEEQTVDVSVTNGNGFTTNKPQAFSYTYFTPDIYGVSDSYVPVDGTDHTVTISGTNFENGTTVKFGDQELATTFVSNIELSVVVPTTGFTSTQTVDVTVTNPNGRSVTLSQAFTYAIFSIRGLSNTSMTADGTWYTTDVLGYQFEDGATVTVDGKPAIVLQHSDTSITIRVPTEGVTTQKSVDVTVTNPGGASQTLVAGLTFVPRLPTISGIEFSMLGDKKVMTVTGTQLPPPFQAIFSPTYATLNGAQLPFCSENFGSDAATLIGAYNMQPSQVSDAPPCYLVLDSSSNIILTDTQMIVWLPDAFDETAPGVIGIGGVNYAFNQVDGGSGGSDGATGGSDGTSSGNASGANSSTAGGATGGVKKSGSSSAGGNQATTDETAPVLAENTAPTVNTDAMTLKSGTTIDAKPTFTGVATPFSKVTVLVHSDPVACETTADELGMWSCTLPSTLPAGQHTVTVTVVTPDNQTTVLGPYTVTVAAGEAAQVSGQVAVKDSKNISPLIWVIAGIVLLVCIVAVSIRLRRKQQKSS